MGDPVKTIALFGGEPFKAILASGEVEDVMIRVLPIRDFQRLAQMPDDELHRVEVYCNKPPGWAETLSRESHETIVTKGDELNADFFCRWARRTLDIQEKLMPGITERRASAYLNGAQKSQPKSATPEIKS